MEAGQAGLTTTNFAVSTTPAAVASTTITVPAGFTTALVFSSAHVFAYNPTASGEYLYIGSEIAPTTPAFIPTEVGPTSWATAHGSSSRIVTGLSGGTIGVAAIAHSNTAAWAAQTANIATIDAIALFIR